MLTFTDRCKGKRENEGRGGTRPQRLWSARFYWRVLGNYRTFKVRKGLVTCYLASDTFIVKVMCLVFNAVVRKW